ncbi:MAG: DUF4430 domain-containing protein [Clostridium sp.]|nr:DUF4430 domain-containing protein [Clostridium sp.]
MRSKFGWWLALCLLLAGGLLGGCGEPAPKAEAGALTCTVEIRCDVLVGNAEMTNEDILPYIPENGEILAATEVSFNEGATALDVLKSVAQEQKMQLDFEQSPAYGAYVKGINNIYGKELGDMSGWLYQVNGESPSVGCSSYQLADGDKVVWQYSADMSAETEDDAA